MRDLDETLRVQVENLCRNAAAQSFGDIHVDVKDAVVTLRGDAASRTASQTVEEAILAIPGVADVVNELRVHGLWDRESHASRESRIHRPLNPRPEIH